MTVETSKSTGLILRVATVVSCLLKKKEEPEPDFFVGCQRTTTMKLKLLSFIATLSFSSLPTIAAWSLSTTSTDNTSISTRRSWLCKSAASVAGAIVLQPVVLPAFAEEEEQEAYDNPNIPAGPEEKSGLVVLRVAEVAQFQEKILRAIRECNDLLHSCLICSMICF